MTDLCQKMKRLAQNKKILVSTVSRMIQKTGGKNLIRSSKSLLSSARVHKRLERSIRLLIDLKNHGNRILIFFSVDLVFNKQNDRVITSGNDVSEYRRVSTTKHPTAIIMLGIVASPIWFERGCRLTHAVYKEDLATKVLSWVKQITKNLITSFNRMERRHTRQRLQHWLDVNMSFLPKHFWPTQSSYLNPFDFNLSAH